MDPLQKTAPIGFGLHYDLGLAIYKRCEAVCRGVPVFSGSPASFSKLCSSLRVETEVESTFKRRAPTPLQGERREHARAKAQRTQPLSPALGAQGQQLFPAYALGRRSFAATPTAGPGAA